MPKSNDNDLASGGMLGADAKKQLQAISARVIELLTQRDELNEDLKEVMQEAKDAGFDTKILRKAIKRIRSDVAALKAEEDMIDSYVHAIQPDLFDKAA